jgi:uncharacterized membrane protein
MEDSEVVSSKCQICNREFKTSEMFPSEFVREPLIKLIKKSNPDWESKGYICFDDLNYFRTKYVAETLEDEKGELSILEKKVMDSLKENEILSQNINIEYESKLTFGERLADKLADFAGSWTFVSIFAFFLVIWVAINSIVLIFRPFDPYPFILLNLILSCIAAIQAPLIMMSQNRQEDKDRLRAEHDYIVNLKAEIEVKNLNEKIDHLIMSQWQKLLEIQEIQTELMQDVVREVKNNINQKK